MRKIILLACLCLCLQFKSRAQYFDLLNLTFGLLQSAQEGGYEGRITLYNNSACILHGLKGVWYLGDRFNLGYTLHYGNNVVNSLINRQRYRMYTIESGFYVEYVHKRNNRQFLSFPLHMSVGSFYVPPTYVPIDQPNAAPYLSLEPRVQANKVLFSWAMVSASLGYRFISAGSLYGSNSANLAGPSFNFSLVFGDFK